MRLSASMAFLVLCFLACFASGFSTSPRRSVGFGHPLTSPHHPLTICPLDSPSRKASSAQSALGQHVPRGGAKATKMSAAASSPIDTGSKCPVTGLAAVFGSLYGAGGVVYVLVKAIKRVLPIALEPFQAGNVALSPLQLGAYVATCLWFAYYEGYKGFQKSFSPLVVKRSFTLIPGKNGVQWYHFLVAPLYSMGLLHATRKRQIVSWSVSVGIATIVAAVKRLPYPWRNVVDAGVAVGLSWGSLSIIVLYAKAWLTGELPATVDAALPPTPGTEPKK